MVMVVAETATVMVRSVVHQIGHASTSENNLAALGLASGVGMVSFSRAAMEIPWT